MPARLFAFILAVFAFNLFLASLYLESFKAEFFNRPAAALFNPPSLAPILPNEFKELLRTKGVAPSGNIGAAMAAICIRDSEVFANMAPASFPAPYNSDITGKITNNPLKVETHFLKRPSVFGNNHAANATGDMATSNIITACLTINVTNIAKSTNKVDINTGPPIARNANIAVPVKASPESTAVLQSTVPPPI